MSTSDDDNHYRNDLPRSSQPVVTMDVLVERLYALERRMLDQFEANRRAVAVSYATMEKRLESMNELRAQINDERGRYITTTLFDAKHSELQRTVEAKADELGSRIATLAERVQENNVRIVSGETRMTTIVAIITFAVPIAILGFNYFLGK
jgi:hypothetical protein